MSFTIQNTMEWYGPPAFALQGGNCFSSWPNDMTDVTNRKTRFPSIEIVWAPNFVSLNFYRKKIKRESKEKVTFPRMGNLQNLQSMSHIVSGIPRSYGPDIFFRPPNGSSAFFQFPPTPNTAPETSMHPDDRGAVIAPDGAGIQFEMTVRFVGVACTGPRRNYCAWPVFIANQRCRGWRKKIVNKTRRTCLVRDSFVAARPPFLLGFALWLRPRTTTGHVNRFRDRRVTADHQRDVFGDLAP